jgi:hypothetical protein
MTRSHRRLVAWIGILGIAFAHIAVAAQACVIRGDVLRDRAAVAVPSHADHCAGAYHGAAPVAPPGNACEVQCTDGTPFAAVPDLAPVAHMSLPFLPLAPPTSVDVRAWDRSVLAAAGAGPPPLLLCCRLLN